MEPQGVKISVIDDKEKANQIRQALLKNDNYCPCALEKSEDYKCMCKEFIETPDEGLCKCGLYIKTFLYN